MRTELIWYDRPDVAGPKECKYNKFDVPQEILEPLKTSLQCSMGIKGEVNKTRTLFIHERTRIHIDSVEGLGDFMELEVCLSEEESALAGEKVAHELKAKLGVADDDLLEGAYMDMLKTK